MKRFIPDKFLIPLAKAWNIFRDEYAVKSYSQEGEDMILRRLFEEKKSGFYVDIGAHHPRRFSNTCIFYKQGWRGINIDAIPGTVELFNKHRPRDINLEIAVSDSVEDLTYYEFNDPALNGFSKEIATVRNSSEKFVIVATKKMTTMPLSNILEKHLPEGQYIDFMTIDVEGWDLKVLKSNDWNRYQPGVVLVEILDTDLSQIEIDPIAKLLMEKSYVVFAKCVNTWIFKLQP
ncbi:MAG: FkbM family methyltransferase [Candidatus Promineifilaceae bacterium]|nr:FkbM family methyltransferase [Candidatus Promineifilaceae bacterium]